MARRGMMYALIAAAFYALNMPCSKLLLQKIPETILAGLLYLGAGTGIFLITHIRKREPHEKPLDRKDLPFIVLMIALDIIAPIYMLLGLQSITASSAALLNNFEIVTTSLIAWLIFNEPVTKRLGVAVCLVTAACLILSIEDKTAFHFSSGCLYVLAASACWGLENNCTRKLSCKDAPKIVMIKGLCSGTGSLLIGLFIGERARLDVWLVLALFIGFIAYGLSITFYLYAQRFIGAAKTSTFYAISPFLGTILACILFKEMPAVLFGIALLIMLFGTFLAAADNC